jgi:hypothetical protein
VILAEQVLRLLPRRPVLSSHHASAKSMFTSSLAPPRGYREPGQIHPAFPRKRPRNCVRSLPACGLAALNLWAGPKQGRIRAGQNQT